MTRPTESLSLDVLLDVFTLALALDRLYVFPFPWLGLPAFAFLVLLLAFLLLCAGLVGLLLLLPVLDLQSGRRGGGWSLAVVQRALVRIGKRGEDVADVLFDLCKRMEQDETRYLGQLLGRLRESDRAAGMGNDADA